MSNDVDRQRHQGAIAKAGGDPLGQHDVASDGVVLAAPDPEAGRDPHPSPLQRVEHGQPLFTVSAKAEVGLTTEFKRIEADKGALDAGIPEGMFGVRSPTDGIFYRRANPQSPPYVEK